ncbi:MAG: hypothetical protein CMP12_19825 [Zunongwangia sp.]|nr:hypothetical protein [Zunongwangia sp.]
MNEDQAKVILKKSTLKTTDNFTDSVMEQIEANTRVQFKFPPIKNIFFKIVAVVLPLFFLLFFKTFTFLPRLEIFGDVYRTKLFALLLFSVLLGINYLLKLHYSSKQLVKN